MSGKAHNGFFGKLVGLLVVATTLVACDGNSSSSDSASISGSRTVIVAADTQYSFHPKASGSPVSFSINNKPGWASFSVSTGELLGSPRLRTPVSIRTS